VPAPQVYLSRSGRFAWERLSGMEGFVIADPFDDFLARVGEEYLAGLWTGLARVIDAHGIQAGELTWGSGHPGYTFAVPRFDNETPLGFFGWVMPGQEGPSFWDAQGGLSPYGDAVAADLARSGLSLALAGADIRSWMCRRVENGADLAPVAPYDAGAGLELVIEHCTDDLSDWAPTARASDGDEVCAPVADALVSRDREALFDALEAARRACTPAGYRILALGFSAFVLDWLRDDTPGLEPRDPGGSLVALDLAGDLRLTIGHRRQPEWLSVEIGAQHAAVHRHRMGDFVAGLGAVAAGRAGSTTLRPLGQVWELIVTQDAVTWVTEDTLTLPAPRTTAGRLYAALRPHRSNWQY
jgi:hypothetical protein